MYARYSGEAMDMYPIQAYLNTVFVHSMHRPCVLERAPRELGIGSSGSEG
jgi:hypothetical protein